MKKHFSSVDELKKDTAMQAMSRYAYRKAIVGNKEMIVVPTMQQIEDPIYNAAAELCEAIFDTYDLERNDGVIEDIRDAIYQKLEENGICFLPLFEEY